VEGKVRGGGRRRQTLVVVLGDERSEELLGRGGRRRENLIVGRVVGPTRDTPNVMIEKGGERKEGRRRGITRPQRVPR